MTRVAVTEERYQQALKALNQQIRRVYGPDATVFASDGTRPPRYVSTPITLTKIREMRSRLLQLGSAK